jgi:hypothetical protein
MKDNDPERWKEIICEPFNCLVDSLESFPSYWKKEFAKSLEESLS